MENLEKLSISEVLALIDQISDKDKFCISFDNCFSSQVLKKSDKMFFLKLHNDEENFRDQKVFYKKENLRGNYFTAINKTKVSI